MLSKGLVVGVIVAVLLAAVAPVHAQLTTTRFSLTEAGEQANGGSWWPTIDGQGRFVAFHSWATNLGPTDHNFVFDTYVRDRIFGYNHLVSSLPTGTLGNRQSVYPTISADGLHVAFSSDATNLVAGDTNGVQDVYVSDWQYGTIERVSVSSTGEQANDKSEWPWLSGDGRYVVFQSSATNLIPGGNPSIGVYLRDRLLGTTECISRRTDGSLPNGRSYAPWISPDGRYIVFSTWGDLIPQDDNPGRDVYLLDRTLDKLELISVVNGTGAMANGDSGGMPRPIGTPDGRFVIFSSLASNLVEGDTNGAADVFVRDRLTGTTQRVSVSSLGEQGNSDSGDSLHASYALGISANGRYAVFSSSASDLVPNDTNGFWDAFRHDRVTGETVRMSESPEGAQGNNISGYFGISTSDNGMFTVFDSHATTFVPNDTNSCMDTFLYSPVTVTGTPVAVINGDAPYTASQEVTLSVAPFDCSEVRFRNGSGLWSDWEPALTTKPWTLSPGDGVKRVSVQGRYADLTESPEAWDEIVLQGSPPGEVSVLINGGADSTATRDVTLTVHAVGALEMRFRNESGAWSPWQPYAETAAWQLSFGDGTKQVSVQTRSAAGVLSAEASDDILLNATPPGGVTFTINGDAAFTSSRDVVLTISAAPDTAEMRFRNEDTDLWSDWEPIASTKSWTVSEGDGLKTVYAQGRDELATESAVTSDDITLDTTPPAALTLQIDDGAGTTSQQSVVLSLTAPEDVTEIRLRNEESAWSDWRPFAEDMPWSLSEGDGPKHVEVQGRDEAGNLSDIASADIVLDTAGPTSLNISINGGADFTLVRTVTLTLSAAGATQMRFRNEDGPWSDWEAFATTKQWDLSPGRGEKTVGFQCRDAAANESSEATDSITWGGFADVATGFWAYSQIMACVDAGIVQGFSFDNTYRPKNTVTRGQMAAYIARAMCEGEENVPAGPPTPTFPDVGTDNGFYRHIEYCYAHGVVTGFSYDSTYRPQEPVTRGQMAAFLARAKCGGEEFVPVYTGEPSFPDVAPDSKFYNHVEYIYLNGITTGKADGLYHAADSCLRDQMAVFIARAFGLTTE